MDGVYPVGVTCPECGAGLKRAGAIRQGVRKRMPVLVGFGITLGVVPLLALIVAVYAVLSGGGVYRQLPTGMLMWSAEFGSGASSGPIADELMNRLTNQAEPMQAALISSPPSGWSMRARTPYLAPKMGILRMVEAARLSLLRGAAMLPTRKGSPACMRGSPTRR